MGTDIHSIFQRKTANGEWEDIPSDYEQDRDYQLFAVLGGVRNGYGFAGIPTGEAVVPIAEGRGYPEGFEVSEDEHPILSQELRCSSMRKYFDDLTLWMGDHSHSWASGEELLAWKPLTVWKTGVVARAEWEKRGEWKCGPPGYCGGVFGKDVVVVHDDVEAALKPHWTHRTVEWEQPLQERLSYFFDEVRRLVEMHGEIRFVFGFDS